MSMDYDSIYNTQINTIENKYTSTPSKNTKISIKDYNVLKLIGRGIYGIVFLIEKNNKKYTLKISFNRFAKSINMDHIIGGIVANNKEELINFVPHIAFGTLDNEDFDQDSNQNNSPILSNEIINGCKSDPFNCLIKYTIMEYIDGVHLEDYKLIKERIIDSNIIFQQLYGIIKMMKYGYIVYDCHIGNVILERVKYPIHIKIDSNSNNSFNNNSNNSFNSPSEIIKIDKYISKFLDYGLYKPISNLDSANNSNKMISSVSPFNESPFNEYTIVFKSYIILLSFYINMLYSDKLLTKDGINTLLYLTNIFHFYKNPNQSLNSILINCTKNICTKNNQENSINSINYGKLLTKELDLIEFSYTINIGEDALQISKILKNQNIDISFIQNILSNNVFKHYFSDILLNNEQKYRCNLMSPFIKLYWDYINKTNKRKYSSL